jgi:glycosyltransferase involved in cell wall biosynthesis
MKVLFSHPLPFFLAHGGAQTLIEALMRELSNLGVTVEPVRWWDEKQTGDIIHYVCRTNSSSIRFAHEKKFKVVMTDLLDQTASRSRSRLFLQRAIIQAVRLFVPRLTGAFSWAIYRELDAMVFAVGHEWDVAQYLFDADPQRGSIIPHGLETEALAQLSQPATEEDYLVSCATIHPRKNSVLLAEAAHRAKVPIVFLGKAYSETDAYFLRFKALVDGKYVRHPGFVTEMEKFRYLRGARGFALLSQYESGCIAVYEAAAAGLPLFLSNLPWASKSYPLAKNLQFASLGNAGKIADALGRFYQTAHRAPEQTFPVLSWREVAKEYVRLYEKVLSRK